MRIGVDMGGTKIELVALADDGELLSRERIATPRGDYEGTVRAIAGLVAAHEARLGQRASVGVGIPGSLDPTSGLVQNANSTWLIGKPFDRDLGKAMDRTVRMANDANCFALSEAVDGAGAGKRVVFGVILGTGCGSGIVVGRQVIEGLNRAAGEWGHMPLPWQTEGEYPGPICWCGQVGCLETWISGSGLERDHEAHAGEELAASEIVARAGEGEPKAASSLKRYEDRLARALAVIVNLVDPDIVVLGGGMSNVASLYERVPPLIAPHAFARVVRTPIVKNRHGDSSGVRGAAWLWPESTAAR
ncbi:MAG: ROK family protein [Alphaproteobacteria bacterium]|nr:ROK family protein [Alphaproteobacteria bacterium]